MATSKNSTKTPTPITSGIVPAPPEQQQVGVPINELFEAIGRAQFIAQSLEKELVATRQALQAAQARIAELESAKTDVKDASDAGGD
jgi:hypothetical protein